MIAKEHSMEKLYLKVRALFKTECCLPFIFLFDYRKQDQKFLLNIAKGTTDPRR